MWCSYIGLYMYMYWHTDRFDMEFCMTQILFLKKYHRLLPFDDVFVQVHYKYMYVNLCSCFCCVCCE